MKMLVVQQVGILRGMNAILHAGLKYVEEKRNDKNELCKVW